MSRALLAALLLLGIAAGATVNVMPAPANCLAPDAAMDRTGILHLVYGLAHDAFYAQSTDNGRTFSTPVKLNRELGVTTTMGERGPKISLGSDGTIHVIWADQWSPGVKTYARYANSTDGGKTFTAPKAVSPDMPAPDGLTMAADGAGTVLIFWHVMADPKPVEKQATWLYMARSTDKGETFSAPERVKIDNAKGIACSMCIMRARIGADGNAYLTFRNAESNVRDFLVLKGPKTENNFTALRVNEDNWVIDFCPMCGPEQTFSPTGRALVAFMVKKKVYWAISDDKRATFTQHVATPANEENEIYPTALANRKGEGLFLWQVGPMSVNSTAVVKWALYTVDGIYQNQQGTLGTSFSGTKATAFVGKDDNFYILTTAK
jgi:hypothetical protein